MATCRYCNQSAGFLRKQHGACRDLHATGIQEMTQLAAQAAGTSGFNETALRSTLQAIAARAQATEDDICQAIAAGWAQGVSHAMSDGIITQEEETRLRHFRDQLVSGELPSITTGSATLNRATTLRITTQARHAALSTRDGGAALQELDNTLRRTSMSSPDLRQILVRAWESAVEDTIEGTIITLDEENALSQYLDHFGIPHSEVNTNGAHTSLVQAAVIRDITQGIVPQRQNVQGQVPFNIMKSEQLVWTFQNVDYLETVTRRERRGSSQGVSIRVAKGLYYSPRQFQSRAVEWEETVKADTGLLGLTTKHLYFSGSQKKFRVRYDRIVSFDPYEDGLGIMRDAQTAKPQTFITGDGWFVYNLAVNLAQM